ncbi:MAG TPA: hypothetical protein VFN22_04820 [Gemmatimonadales bacterium]|nr:hypothetical protein [Gemmatimonadales bacterium]
MSESNRLLMVLATALIGCGGGGGTGPGPVVNCASPIPVALPVGGIQLVDASQTGCVEFAGVTAAEEYLVVGYSGAGQVTQSGVSGAFEMRVGAPTQATVMSDRRALAGRDLVPGLAAEPENALAFHAMLRRREAALAASGAAELSPRSPAFLRGPPTVGQQDGFQVCATLACTQFTPITATARVVGERGVIWVDNAPTDGTEQLSLADLQQLGALFDDYLYPIDTTAFGATSDIDGNQRVDIVISERVNQLTTDCTNGRVVGYFFGGDLLATHQGSNQREVFFAFAPRPTVGNCPAVTRTTALRALPPVLIHELQHMISFNERVLRRGRSDEVSWLNEGLSQFAEDLGQFLIPDLRCPTSTSCFSQFGSGNLRNAYEFMLDPEATFLVSPRDDGPTLEGRGASWLFIRWLADHFSSDTLRGTTLTRALTSGAATGADNIASATGVPFPTLVGEWLSTLWVDDLPGFPQAGRLRYRTWNFRSTYARNSPGTFPKAYPLEPILVTSSGTSGSGTLRGGTGRFLRVALAAGNGPMQVRLTGPGGVAPAGALSARIAVVRTK